MVAAAQLTAPGHAEAQAEEEDEQNSTRATFWLGYMGSLRFDPSWSLWFDTHYNHDAFLVLRGGLTRHFDTGPSLTGGYAYLFLNPGDGSLDRSEHRAWAQISLPVRFSERWGFSQRIRNDLRFRQRTEDERPGEGWIVTNRLRLQSVVTYWMPPMSFGRFLLQVAEEALVDFGPDAGPNFLNQNRLSALFGLKRNGVTVRLGYMHRFLPGSTGDAPRHEHAALLWVNHVISLVDADPQAPDAPDPAVPESSNP